MKPGTTVSSGSSMMVSEETISSAVMITPRAARVISKSNARFPLIRALPSASAAWTWMIAQSGWSLGIA